MDNKEMIELETKIVDLLWKGMDNKKYAEIEIKITELMEGATIGDRLHILYTLLLANCVATIKLMPESRDKLIAGISSMNNELIDALKSKALE